MLEVSERRQLLDLAYRSIENGIDRPRPAPGPGAAWPPPLVERRATFTTLSLAGELRGCCGSLDPVRPLAEDVWHNAWASAFADPRFGSVTTLEIEALQITISVLTPLEPFAFEDEFDLVQRLERHVDGLVLACGARRVTFLPAVWEMLPDTGRFLAELKRKAGWSSGPLPSGTRAWRYRTESFSGTRTESLPVERGDAMAPPAAATPGPARASASSRTGR